MSKLQNFELDRIEFQPDFMNFQNWRLALFWELVPRTWNCFFALTFCLRWWGLNRFSILPAKKNISRDFCSPRDQKNCSVGLFSPYSASGPNLPVREFGVTWVLTNSQFRKQFLKTRNNGVTPKLIRCARSLSPSKPHLRILPLQLLKQFLKIIVTELILGILCLGSFSAIPEASKLSV